MTAPDPTILAEAIKRSEADMQLFRGIDDPEIKKLVEFCDVILVAAKAYGPMREALEKAANELGSAADRVANLHRLLSYGLRDAERRARTALNPAGLA